MKTIRYAFWAIIGLLLIIVGLANRDIVTLHAMPTAIADLLHIPSTIQIPLFVAIFAGVALGLLIGFFWEWLRERQYRSEASRAGRENKKLKEEMARLRDSDGDGRDDVLQILEGK